MVLAPKAGCIAVFRCSARALLALVAASTLLAGLVLSPAPVSAASTVTSATHDRFFEPDHTGEGDFAYAPSSITDGGRQYHFYCGNQVASRVVDSIYMVTFKAVGSRWVREKDELVLTRSPRVNGVGRWDSEHVCDPSVVRGDFRFSGEDYQYAMFYTGTNDPEGTGTFNSVGVAFSNNLTDWVRKDAPLVSRRANEGWGVGQPSAIAMPDGSVYLFYTRSDPTRTVWRTFTTNGSSSPVLGPEQSLSLAGTQQLGRSDWAIFNSDFAYDPATDRFWMVKPSAFDRASPSFISTEVEVLWTSGDTLRTGSGMWHSIGTIGRSITGEAKNHNAGLQRTPEGFLADPKQVRVNVTTSPSAVFPLALFGYNLSAVTVPVRNLVDPFAAVPAKMSSINPYRAVDTRNGGGGTLGEREIRRYKLTDTPAGATAVTMNLTAVRSAANGFVAAWDCQGPPPETSNLNYLTGDTRANQVTIPVHPTTGEVCFYSRQATDLIVDVFAWYGASAGPYNLSYVPRSPRRLFDSRKTTKFAEGETREFAVKSLVEAGAAAVTFNLTTIQAEAASYATVWPCDQERPTLSSINTATAGQARANQVTVRLDGAKKFCVFSSKPQHLIIDVTGSWVGGKDAGLYSQVPPRRWIDTRLNVTALAAGETRRVMPPQNQTIVGQLTATKTQGAGNYGLYPCDQGYGGTSTVNFVAAGETASVAFYMRADQGGICVRAATGGDMIIDINGYLGL